MANGNPRLADVLAEDGTAEDVLSALADGGILVVSKPDGSVLVGELDDGSVALAGFTSPEEYSEKADTDEFRHADAALLLEMGQSGEVGLIVVNPENENSALIPFSDVQAYLVMQGIDIQEDVEVSFRASEHDLVPRLKDGIADQLKEFQEVQRVWISDVRMPSGVEGIMLHVVLDEGADPQTANGLLQSTMEGLPPADVPVFAHLADPNTEEFLAEMEAAVVRR